MFYQDKNCDHLEVILKTVERCNLNCSYCYFFHGGDQSYKENPSLISKDTLQATTDFLAQGCRDLALKRINLNLHGGEPMLQRKQDFDDMCTLFRSTLDPLTDLTLTLQTNGTLISSEWIELFEKHRVKVSVSCDGPEAYHDKFRVDHKGRGSHAKMVEGIQKLNDAKSRGIIEQIGILCVIDPSREPQTIYSHFRNDLKITFMDFLLPDMTHDSFTGNPEAYGHFLCKLFDAWTEEDNPQVFVRILAKALKHLTMSKMSFNSLQKTEAHYREFTISSNGKLGSVDTLRAVSPRWMWAEESVGSISLKDYLGTPILENLQKALQVLPEQCHQCCWKNVCRGGYMVHRFSKKNAFNNPTIYCQSIKIFYSHVAKYLINNNYPLNDLTQLLCTV